VDAATPPTAAPLSHSEALRIILATMLPIFMGSLDTTVLASALPAIGRDLGHVRDLPWLITTYLIAATASTPLYGKVSDTHGRRFALMIALGCYLAGSLICALAPDMTVLILGRVLHGLGGGGLTSTGMVVLGDVASPKDRAKYYGYFSITYTTAGAAGPPLGGLIADHLHWSAIFWLNIPLGLAAVFFTLSALRRLPRHDRPHKLDFIGAALIVIATVAFMYAITSGGVRYPWSSLPILGLLGFAIVVATLFVARLLTAAEPLIPLSIMRDAVARHSIASNSFGWGAIIGLNVFLPMYLQTVLGQSATRAGLSLMILMGLLNISAGLTSPLIAHYRRYKVLPLIGLGAAILAVAVLCWQAGAVSPWSLEILLAILGLGFGPLAPLTGVALQNTVPPYHFGTAMGAMNFLRSLFATIMIAIFGAIVLRGPLGAAQATAEGFQIIFAIAAASLVISFIAMVMLEEKPLHAKHLT
jgi:EmrB/QacA subfamily drug resistance transporter